MKNKKLLYGIIVAVLIAIGVAFFIWSEKRSFPRPYLFDKSKFCPDYGNCTNYGPASRKCSKKGECIASCAYGCVSKKWLDDRIDCEAIWNFECKCIENVCQRI